MNNQDERDTQKEAEGPLDLGKRAFNVGAETIQDAVDATLMTETEGVKLVGQAVQETAKRSRKFWHILGPGLVTGAADDDPSGVATYSQTGAQYGFKLLWFAPLTLPLMGAIQEMCARIGLVTGRGLASNIKRYFPRWVLLVTAALLLLANIFNIGADLGALAKATQLMAPSWPFWALIFGFTALSLLMQIFVSYRSYAGVLKYLAITLVVYIITAFVIKGFPWAEALKNAVIPHLDFSKTQIILICGILGTTISPYLFFWQTSQEVEEQILDGDTTIASRQGADKKSMRRMRLDNWSGMVFSNIVTFFIIAVCAATLFKGGITNIATAADAAKALEPLAGRYASLLFTLGILGTGLLGIPVLAGSAAYAISEAFGWKEGLYRRFAQAGAFYGIIILSMVVGLIINFVGLDPIKALIYSAVGNGLVAPVVMILIVLLASNKKVMGEWKNGWLSKTVGWIATGVMIIAGLATLYSLFF
jgi:NRAMP (natural resistance-associated macrophage protein)-like metal ion transporter